MSLANQSNERLGQLVSLTAKIESYLSAGSDKKGSKLSTSSNGSNSTLSKDAAVIGGLSSSLSNLIVNANKMNPNAGDKLSMFIIKMSTAVKEAISTGLSQSDVDALNKNLGSLVSGSAGFMKELAKSIIFAIPAMLGAKFFGMTIKILASTIKNIPALSEGARETLKTINEISKNALKFGLAMAAYNLIGVLALSGAVFFGLTVSLTFKVLKSLDNIKNSKQSLKTITAIGIAAAIFGVAMAGIGLMAEQVAKGTLVFILAASATLLVFSLLGAALPAVKLGDFALGSIVRGAAVFAIAMIGIGFFAQQFAFGTLVFILAAKFILSLFLTAALEFPAVVVGDLALGTIIKGVAIFAIAMIGIGFFAEKFALGTLTFILAAGATLLVFGLLGGAFPGVKLGAESIQTISKSVIPFTLAMIIAGFFPLKIITGAIALSIAMGLVGGAAILLGMGKENIEQGSKVMLKLSVAAIAFSAALLILGLIPVDSKTLLEKLGIVALVMVGLGVAAAILGSPAVLPFVQAGAGVLMLLSISLAIFAVAVFLLSKTNLKQKTVDQISYAITELSKTLAFAGLFAIPMAIGAAGLIAASLSLITLSVALSLFKAVEFTEEDGKSIKTAISSVVQGFVHALDGVSPMQLLKAMAAIPLVGQMGNALVSLASGVKAMATLSFTEMEYDKKAGKLIPKRVVKLTDAEIQQVGPNVAAILNALAMPLTMFGIWSDAGSTSIGPFSFGSGYMSKGIETAAKIGSIISSLAFGVANMANLNVVEYEVVNPGTSKAKLVPATVRKLTEDDFTNAGNNVGAILMALTQPLIDFGTAVSTEGTFKFGSFSFGSGNIEKAIEAAANIGNIVSSLALGVANMANLNVVEYEVVNQGTSKAKLVPKTVRKLSGGIDEAGKATGDFKAAGDNVGALLMALTQPLIDFGKAMTGGESKFLGFTVGSGDIERGIEGISKIGDPISKLADTVIKMASGQIQVYEAKNGKMVLKEVLTFAQAIPVAVANAKRLLMGEDEIGTGSLVGVLLSFANYIESNEEKFNTAADFIPNFETTIASLAKVSTDYAAIFENLNKTAKSKVDPAEIFTKFATSLTAIGNSFSTMGKDKLTLYSDFVTTTTKLTNIITPFEKFTKLFGTFTKDLGSFVKTWNSFGTEETNNFKTYADSLDKISKIDVSKLKETTQTIKEQTLRQQGSSFTNSNNFSIQTAGMNTNSAAGQNMNNSGNNMKPAAAGEKKSGGIGVNPGTVIAELHVTNLYINNKLQ